MQDSRQTGIDTAPGRCVVVGAGLAGAAVAASLARRGWKVTVADSHTQPAGGASSLPAGLMAPHYSSDDAVLSRLTRAGIRLTLEAARTLLAEGTDWGCTGVLEHRPGKARDAVNATEAMQQWTRDADAGQLAAAGLEGATGVLWHELAAWIKPAALVQAWLAQPGVRFAGGRKVDRIDRIENVAQAGARAAMWRVAGGDGAWTEEAELVVIAAAHASAALSPLFLPLQPVRGQVTWGEVGAPKAFPPFPVNGNGHFIPRVPTATGDVWFCGSTYGRGDTSTAVRDEDHAQNLVKLRELLPHVARELEQGDAREWRGWANVRCASADRRPLAGELAPGLWVSTAMGSRGLTFAWLCAESIAARLHGEPLPLDASLARAIDVARLRREA